MQKAVIKNTNKINEKLSLITGNGLFKTGFSNGYNKSEKKRQKQLFV